MTRVPSILVGTRVPSPPDARAVQLLKKPRKRTAAKVLRRNQAR
jgi:hypothetical protein